MPGGSGRETPAGGRGPLRRGCAMVTRRQLLKAGAVGGAGLLVPWEAVGRAWAAIPGGSLDPTTIHKYAAPLVIPPVMPPLTGPRNQSIDRYAIAVRQCRQQVLPPGMPATTVWGYGSAPHRGTFNYPAFTIEARVDRPVRVKRVNDLVDRTGRYLPHLLPVDPTLHWAKPPQAAWTDGTCARGSPPRPVPTPGRFPSSPTCTGATARRRAMGTPRPGTCPMRTTFRPATRGWGASTTSSGASSRTSGTRHGLRGQPCSST